MCVTIFYKLKPKSKFPSKCLDQAIHFFHATDLNIFIFYKKIANIGLYDQITRLDGMVCWVRGGPQWPITPPQMEPGRADAWYEGMENLTVY